MHCSFIYDQFDRWLRRINVITGIDRQLIARVHESWPHYRIPMATFHSTGALIPMAVLWSLMTLSSWRRPVENPLPRSPKVSITHNNQSKANEQKWFLSLYTLFSPADAWRRRLHCIRLLLHDVRRAEELRAPHERGEAGAEGGQQGRGVRHDVHGRCKRQEGDRHPKGRQRCRLVFTILTFLLSCCVGSELR